MKAKKGGFESLFTHKKKVNSIHFVLSIDELFWLKLILVNEISSIRNSIYIIVFQRIEPFLLRIQNPFFYLEGYFVECSIFYLTEP